MTDLGGAVYEGAVTGRFGNRKPPSSAYGGDSPVLHLDATNGLSFDSDDIQDKLGA